MSAADPAGSQKYWLDGAVFDGIRKTASPPDSGTRKYWQDGLAAAFLLSTVASAPPGTATIQGVGTLTAVGASYAQGAASIAGAGSLTAPAVVFVDGTASIAGVGSLAAQGGALTSTSGTIAGTSTAVGDLVDATRGAATIAGVGTLSAIPERVARLIGTSVVAGISNGAVTDGVIAGTSTVTGELIPTYGLVGTIAGTSTVTGVIVRKKAAIGTNAFTYLPLDLTASQFSARRRPMIRIQDSLNDAPNTVSFTSDVLALPGQNLDVDFDDGVGSRFTGEIQRVDFTYEENIDHDLIWNVTAVDYIFQLNKKRPFGNWENESITDIILELFAKYAPGFTTTGLQSGLPLISVIFDGSMSFAACLSYLARMALAKWRLDGYDLQFFTEGGGPNPDDITNSNTDLIRDTPITYTEDISQVRNRVFGKGAAAQAVNDTPPGSDALQVQGLDIFSDSGGLLYTSGMILSYTGRSTVYIPVDRGTTPAGAPSAHAGWDPSIDGYYEAFTYPNIHFSRINWQRGGVKGIVKYYVSYVRDSVGESALSEGSLNVAHINYQPEYVTFQAVGGPEFTVSHPISSVMNTGGGGVPAGSRNWRIGVKYSFGIRTVTPGTANFDLHLTSPGPGPNSVTFSNLPVSGHPDVIGIVFWRKKDADGLFYEVGTAANGAEEFIDRLPDAALGAPFPEDEMFAFQGLSAGIQVKVNVPVSPDPTVRARKLYRAEGQHLTITTQPLELVTINDNVTDEYIDSSALKLTGRKPPEEPAPIARFYLIGIPTSGLYSITSWIRQGADVHLFVQREDVPAQLELATREGGDGIREHDVPDTSRMTTLEEMNRRLDAELILFARSVKTVTYSTRDRKHRVGTTVVFNLLNPPITGTMKVLSVSIDQMHETDDHIGLKERRNVVASTAGRFTLDDLLRKAVLTS